LALAATQSSAATKATSLKTPLLSFTPFVAAALLRRLQWQATAHFLNKLHTETPWTHAVCDDHFNSGLQVLCLVDGDKLLGLFLNIEDSFDKTVNAYDQNMHACCHSCPSINANLG
jgi:hypothetical protein